MATNYLIAPRIQDLENVSYRAPAFFQPNTATDVKGVPVKGGVSIMSKVIIATLCSAVVGIVAAFILFKKVFHSKPNCFVACDGSGVDRTYIEEAHFQSPRRENGYEKSLAVEDMEVVQYDIANGLSIINEESDVMSNSANGSYAMSNASRNTHYLNTSDVWTDTDASVASEKTIHTSNRCRTPQFGADVNGKVSFNREDGVNCFVLWIEWDLTHNMHVFWLERGMVCG